MPSLRDVAHDGVLSTFSKKISTRVGQVVWSVRADGMGRPSRTKLYPSGVGSLSSSQPGGPPNWASPLAFGLIAYEHRGVPFADIQSAYIHICTVCYFAGIILYAVFTILGGFGKVATGK
jgi:hypothetical protein